jgi:hypothetical protein
MGQLLLLSYFLRIRRHPHNQAKALFLVQE